MVSQGAEPSNPDMSGRKIHEAPSFKRGSLTTGSIAVGDVSVGNLDALDDLVSLDSDVGMSTGSSAKQQRQQQQSSPEQQRSTRQLPDYHPIGLTIGQTSPLQSSRGLHSHNAVHMHVQENAKVPGLNISVDRSNSSRPAYHGSEGMSSSTQREIEEIIKLEQKDRTNTSTPTPRTKDSSSFSMAELFLSKESSNRRSLEMNYDNLGAVLSDIGFGGDRTRSRSASMTSSNDASFRNATSVGAAGAATSTSHSRADVEDNTQMEIDALTAAIDPTPWSEIKEKIQKRVGHEEPRQNQRQRQAPQQIDQTINQGSSKDSNIVDTTLATNHPHHYSYYPYGRHHQLPIPEKVPSPPNRPMTSPNMTAIGMADAVATAAALASAGYSAPPTSSEKASSHGPPQHPDATRRKPNENGSTAQRKSAASAHEQSTSNLKNRDPSPIQSAAPQHTKTQQPPIAPNGIPSTSPKANATSSTTPSAVSPTRHFQRHRGPAYNPQHHAAAHATSRASVMAATTQKSQYGFGGNHMVPSVPAPPPTMRGKSTPSSHYHPAYPHNKPVIPNGNKTPPPLPPHHNSHSASPPPPAYAGAAYERKKQRAKDARVKLNDSIERLAVSMSLAGSQSKQRASVLNAKISGVDEAQPSIRAKTLQLLDECTKEAESAKKWDRPSFVGTAASLIQALNSQCDGLMRELVDLQEQLDKAKNNMTASPQQRVTSKEAGAETDGSMAPTSHPDHKRHAAPSISQDNGNDGAMMHPNKRMRPFHIDSVSDQSSASRHSVEEVGEQESQLQQAYHGMGETTDEQSALALVSTMLDPISLCHCPCVSRSWRGIGAYQKDQTWLDLAVKRFGYYNVRQWTEKLQDSGQAVRAGGEMHMKSLYRAMNAANVMPHMPQEGMLFLGEAKIPGRVSGWAFMVERSNGETLRSVKREPAMLSSGDSASTSRGGIGPFVSLPVVELRIVIQNIGMASGPVILKDQSITIDTSTRRSGGELREIHWDDRFTKVVNDCNGVICDRPSATRANYDMNNELCSLKLFDTKILKVHIHARGCSTMSRFQQRSNFTKILVCLDGTTIPLVIPFLRDGSTSQL